MVEVVKIKNGHKSSKINSKI